MKTQHTLRALAAGLLVLVAGSAYANTVTMYNTDFDGIPDAQGGEFKAVTDKNGTFYTFCLERFVHLGFTTYTYEVNDRAYGANADAHDPTGLPGDPLSKGTAYLYEMFSKGTLVGSNGTGSYWDEHDKNAGLLQMAFWTLEDEYNYGPNPYVDLVKSIFGATGAFETYTGSQVRVMNLWGPNGLDIQSQLIYVPDTGATLLLFGVGLLSLAAFRKRLLPA